MHLHMHDIWMDQGVLMRFLCILFTSPVQNRNVDDMIHFAERAGSLGQHITIFMIGDGVYCASAVTAESGRGSSVSRLSRLVGADLICCSTCAAARGVTRLIPNARFGTLEDLNEGIACADAVLNYTG